jgi:hypothetical protein
VGGFGTRSFPCREDSFEGVRSRLSSGRHGLEDRADLCSTSSSFCLAHEVDRPVGVGNGDGDAPGVELGGPQDGGPGSGRPPSSGLRRSPRGELILRFKDPLPIGGADRPLALLACGNASDDKYRLSLRDDLHECVVAQR